MNAGNPIKFISLFAGIGGIDLGLERSGMECVAQVEIDPFCRRVLAKHWPNVPKFEDVRTFTRGSINGQVDLIAGGFPCQDLSVAGRGIGLSGSQSGLWWEYFRVIREFRPRFVLVENVSAILVRGFGTVLRCLAEVRYDAEWRVFQASEFGAPHQRDRLFIVAYSDEKHGEAWMGNQSHGTTQIFRSCPTGRDDFWLQAPCRTGGMDDGISKEPYEPRVAALGNAVVPQIAEWIGRRIIDFIDATQEIPYSPLAIGKRED